MKHKKTINIVAFFGILIILSSCIKDEIILKDPKNITRPLNGAGPIFTAHLQAIDLIDKMDSNQFIYVDAEELIHASIDTSFTVVYDNIIDFDELTLDKLYNIKSSIIKSTKANFVFKDTIAAAIIEGQRFDSVSIKAAQMQVEVISPDNFSGSFTITFPELTLANDTVLKFTSSLGGTYTNSKNLEGGMLRFFQNSTDISSFKVVTTVDATPPQGIPTDSLLKVSIKMLDFTPDIILGYFGNLNVIDKKEEMEFDFFKDFDFTDMIQFNDVNLILKIENYFGVPVLASIDSMLFENTESGDEAELEKKDIRVGAATYGQPVIPKIDSITMDLADAINIAPDKLYYEIAGWINPDGDTGAQNFMVNDGESTLEANMRIDIPFWFKTDNYKRTDTINFDIRKTINDSTTIDYLEEINLYFDFTNGFPFSIYAQAYMVDAQGVTIDSLFTGEQLIWKSPNIDATGRAGEPILNKVNISIDHDKAKKLYDNHSTQIFIKSRVKSGGTEQNPEAPTFVKLYSDYIIDISMAFEIVSGEI